MVTRALAVHAPESRESEAGRDRATPDRGRLYVPRTPAAAGPVSVLLDDGSRRSRPRTRCAAWCRCSGLAVRPRNYTSSGWTKTDFAVWFPQQSLRRHLDTLCGHRGSGPSAPTRWRACASGSRLSVERDLDHVPGAAVDPVHPAYAQIRTMGLADSLGRVIAAYPSFTLPFVTWLSWATSLDPGGSSKRRRMIDGRHALRRVSAHHPAARGTRVLAAGLFAFTQASERIPVRAGVSFSDVKQRTLPVGLSHVDFGRRLRLGLSDGRRRPHHTPVISFTPTSSALWWKGSRPGVSRMTCSSLPAGQPPGDNARFCNGLRHQSHRGRHPPPIPKAYYAAALADRS